MLYQSNYELVCFTVMQFGGQRPAGPGVPSIGMALPGFVSQQQLGLSNSEMTW